MSDVSGLDKFLSQFDEGDLVSTGSFTLSAEKMLEKLELAVDAPEKWILKVVQAAVLADARFFITKIGRMQLKCQAVAGEFFPLTKAQDFLTLDEEQRCHKNLLLAFLWIKRMEDLKSVRVRWSTSSTIEVLEYKGDEIQTSHIPVEPTENYRFLEFLIERKPVTLMEKMFRKVSFAGEVHLLGSRTLFAPLTQLLDSRELRSDSHHLEAGKQAIYTSPGSSGLNALPLPRRFWRYVSKDERHRQLRKGSSVVDATAYAEVVPEDTSRLHWVSDGVLIDDCKEADEDVFSSRQKVWLFLSATDLPLDLSTLALIDSDARSVFASDKALHNWLHYDV